MAPTSSPALEVELSKLRRLATSAQPHQSKPANLLLAIESTIASTLSAPAARPPYSATAYFAALLQCLDKACSEAVASSSTSSGKDEAMASGALIPATLYLLAVVVPETSAQVVSSRMEKLLSTLFGLLDSTLEHPPALRSLLQILAAVLSLSTAANLQNSGSLQQAFHTLLELSLDHRPKVRHVAQEGVQKVLTTPATKSTASAHPYLPRARSWVMEHLQEEVAGGSKQGKKKARVVKGEEEGDGKKIIWLIQGLKGWVSVWGQENLAELCSLLLALPPSPHLTAQTYSLLAQLLSTPAGAANASLSTLPTILDSLLSSPPDLRSASSGAEIPTYLNALTSALIKLSLQAPELVPSILPRAFTLIFNQILLSASDNRDVLQAASEAVGGEGLVRYCLTDDMILAAVRRLGATEQEARKGKMPYLVRLIGALREAMNVNALKMEYLLPILTALVSRFRLRLKSAHQAEIDQEGQGPTAAQLLLGDLVAGVADLRLQKGFQDKEAVDDVVGMAIEVMGVEAVLTMIPLNIEPDATGNTPQPGRAHLLPLIRQRTTNDSIAFFGSYFRPLSERVFGRKVAAEDAERGNEAKVWEAIVGQIWDCWPGFCDMPRDLQKGLTPQFLTLITNLLYTQPALLPSLLRGLSQLVVSTQRLLSSTSTPTELKKQFGLDQTGAQTYMSHLRGLAKDMVSVLLNVFSKMPRDSRGMVGDVVGVWTGIMSDSDLLATYTTVTTHLASNLGNTAIAAPGASPISHTMLDLLLIFTAHLPAAQARELFQSTLSPALLQHRDSTVQKKSYRLLKRLLESGKLSLAESDYAQLVEALSGMVGQVGPGAQRDRLQLLTALVEALPSDSLGLLPELLTEAVLGTKEVNERARDAGFELVVAMGQKMAKGGKVKQPQMEAGDEVEEGEDVEDDDEEKELEMAEAEVDANVEEYIKMVAAGLTGTTPHMISASINALSRLVFEFQSDLSSDLLSQLIPTLVLFLSSKNREIVKSALGFTKLIIIALPVPVVQPHLAGIVPGLLGWVHDHKNHFKTKTVHVFERMMRRFGYEEVLALAPTDKDGAGSRKVLEGIRKRKEKAAKKKAASRDADGEEHKDGPKVRPDSGDAFEDILYNSDSSVSSDDEDARPKGKKDPARGANRTMAQPAQARGRDGRPLKSALKKPGGAASGTVLRDEGDDPLDLLSRSIASRTGASAASAHKRKPGQEAAKFKTDKEGRLVISEPGGGVSDDEGESGAPAGAVRRLGDGGLGMRKNTRGDLKFAGNTRSAREAEREEERGMDIDAEGVARPAMGEAGLGQGQKRDGKAGEKDKRKRNKQIGRLGDEFRAKKAGGDIKRTNGPDPYSYVSLNQASARMGTKGRVNLTNKRKGSRR